MNIILLESFIKCVTCIALRLVKWWVNLCLGSVGKLV